jgi:hypothetical protein
MKCAFDFAPPSSKISRRRGKRTGRHKRRYTSQSREAQQSEVLGELCDKATALSPNSGLTGSEPRNGITTTPWDTVRHCWEPQFCSKKSFEPSASGNVFLQPDRYIPSTLASPSLGVHADTRQKESRFSPLSAFLASPPPAVHQVPVSKLAQPVMTQNFQTKRLVAQTPSTSAREAVASACQTFAMDRANTAALEAPPPSFVHTSPLHSPVAQPTVYLHRQTPEPSHAMASTSSPFPITSPHTAPPILTPTSSSSPFRPMDFRPEHVSSELPQPLSADSMTSPDTTRELYSYWYGYGPDRPSLLATAPTTSLRPFRTLPEPRRTILPPPPGITSLDEALRSSFFGYAGSQRSSVAARAVSVEDFLKMGHANPCWCSNCPNSVPLGELPHEKEMATSTRESKEKRLGFLSANTSGEKQHGKVLADDAREKTDIEATGTATQMESAEADPTPQPSSSSEFGLGFEELTQSVREAVVPGSDSRVFQENTWEIVSARDDRSNRSLTSTPPSLDTVSERALTSEPGVLFMPTRSPAFSDTAWTTTSFDFELGSPHGEVVGASRPTTPSSPLFLWPSPSNSPALTPVLPLTPPPTSVQSPMPIRRSTSVVLSDGTSNVRSI